MVEFVEGIEEGAVELGQVVDLKEQVTQVVREALLNQPK